MTSSSSVASELAPTGVLRAGINLSNFLLVTGKSANGDPEGVAPDMAREIANRLGVSVRYVPFATPGELADAADENIWDIGLIGAEPQRAEKITFSPPYCEIEATYLVPAGSPIKTLADVDQPGVRIAVTGRAAGRRRADRRGARGWWGGVPAPVHEAVTGSAGEGGGRPQAGGRGGGGAVAARFPHGPGRLRGTRSPGASPRTETYRSLF